MNCTEAYKEHIEYTFNAFCRVVIYYAAINAWRDRDKRRQREISFEYLTEEKFYPFCTTELSADYEAEQKELKVIRKYTSFEELTHTLLREFVEKIVIHESEALDGKRREKLRRQEIEIYYSFVGKVELPD